MLARETAAKALRMNHQSLEVFWRSDVVASMLLCTDKSIYAAENVKAMARAVCHSTTPIATDELSAAYGYVDLIDIRVIDVSQRDIAHIGGVTALRKVSAAAEASGIRMAPHACEGRIGGIAVLHVDDAGPNMLAPEICGFGAAGEKNRVWEDLLGLLPFRLSGGCVTVRPNRGTGVHDKLRFTTLNQIAGFGDDVL